jgi:hypothetical protein
MKISELLTAVALPPILLGLVILFSLGCENKEKVLDVETPSGQVEVERNRDTGAIDVQATDKEDQVLDVDTPGVGDIEVNRDAATGNPKVD